MDNASKAMLIAGSILIVILLISMGMRIFSSVSPMEKEVETNVDTVAVSTFNSKFLSYISNSARPSQVRSLIQEVMMNDANIASNGGHKVYISYYKKGSTNDSLVVGHINKSSSETYGSNFSNRSNI